MASPAIVFDDIKHTNEAVVSWPVIFMCAVTIPVASALTNEVTGILPWLTGLVIPIFAGRSPMFIVIFTVIVMMFLTNIGSNIAFGGAMIPVISSLCHCLWHEPRGCRCRPDLDAPTWAWFCPAPPRPPLSSMVAARFLTLHSGTRL